MTKPPRDPRSRPRGAAVRVHTARGRTTSSTRWLQRQLNDPYVAEARRLGYPSRAAFKLIELDDKYHLLRGVRRVVDLGAAPGGWTRVLTERLGEGAKILAVDCLEMQQVQGAEVIRLDFLDPAAPETVAARLGGPADLVLSDMAAPTTGHRRTDHIRTTALCEAALDFARTVLGPGGSFVAKVYQGGLTGDLLAGMKRSFRQVRHAKPPSSRAESVEWYVVATGFQPQREAPEPEHGA